MTPEELLKRAGESNGAAFVLLSVAKMYANQTEDDIFDDVNDFYMVFKTITEKVGDSEDKMKKMLEIIKGAEL
jgi:hypothetical protein